MEEEETEPLDPTVLLISLDGFRWDYFEKTNTPNLDLIINEGVKAASLIPVFPTKTFPNHYSIVTGLYAENHGIVSNTIYDPVFNERFTISNPDAVLDGKWWEGQPIWVTAEKQNQKAATYFWPGSESEIQETRPSYYEAYRGDAPHNSRVDKVVSWLKKDKADRPTFLSLYFSIVDSEGHNHGPDSPEVVDAIVEVDRAVGRLIASLKTEKLYEDLNIILVSDHGMIKTNSQSVVYIDDYINLSEVSITDWYPILGIWPLDGVSTDSLYNQLHGKHPELDVYKKEDLPAEFGYSSHRRIPPILGVLSEGWAATDRAYYPNIVDRLNAGATHGYRPDLISMHGIFVAKGPAFKPGTTLPAVKNVDIYELMCHILGLNPAPNDGSLDSFTTVLAD